MEDRFLVCNSENWSCTSDASSWKRSTNFQMNSRTVRSHKGSKSIQKHTNFEPPDNTISADALQSAQDANIGKLTCWNAMDEHLSTDDSPMIDVGDVCGIFDGHGGSQAVEWISRNYINYLLSAMSDKKLVGIDAQFNSCHDALDDKLRLICQYSSSLNQSSSGTTSSVVLVQERKLIISHVGDCRIVLWYEM